MLQVLPRNDFGEYIESICIQWIHPVPYYRKVLIHHKNATRLKLQSLNCLSSLSCCFNWMFPNFWKIKTFKNVTIFQTSWNSYALKVKGMFCSQKRYTFDLEEGNIPVCTSELKYPNSSHLKNIRWRQYFLQKAQLVVAKYLTGETIKKN